MAAEGLSCLARNGRTGVPTGQAPWGGKPRGRKSHRRRCGSGDRGAAVLRPDQAKERPCGQRAEQHPREKTWRTLKPLHKRSVFPGEEKEALAYRKDAVPIGSIQTGGGATRRTSLCLTGGRADLSKRGKGRLMPRQADDPVIAPISNRSTMRCCLTPLWSRPPGKAMPDLPQPAVPRS